MVLDRDDRLAQARRDLSEGHVLPVLVEAEPRLPGRVEEDGVADPALQAVDGPGAAGPSSTARTPRR